jgi:hypothetical protein
MARRLPAEFPARAVRPAPSMPAALALRTAFAALAGLIVASGTRGQAPAATDARARTGGTPADGSLQEWFVDVRGMC